MEWTDMMHYQQQMQKVVRALLPVRQSVLTASECELLAHLYAAGTKYAAFAQSGKRNEKRGREPLPEGAL